MKRKLIYLSTFIVFFVVGMFLATWNHPATKEIITEWFDFEIPAFTRTEPNSKLAPKGQLKVHLIDVGQGDAILVQAPSGENMLIDGGERSASGDLIKYLRAQGVRKLNVVVATHPHTDHIGGLSAVLETFPVALVCDPGKAGTSNTYSNFLDLVDKKNIPFYLARRGNRLHFANGITVDILNPTNDVGKESMNNASVVLRMTFGKISFLFTGDLEDDMEKKMIKAGVNLQAEVLKVGHHGSDSSTSTLFLGRIAPKIALISVGNNPYGHPEEVVLQRLKQRNIETYITKKQGHIVVLTDGESVSVQTQRN